MQTQVPVAVSEPFVSQIYTEGRGEWSQSLNEQTALQTLKN